MKGLLPPSTSVSLCHVWEQWTECVCLSVLSLVSSVYSADCSGSTSYFYQILFFLTPQAKSQVPRSFVELSAVVLESDDFHSAPLPLQGRGWSVRNGIAQLENRLQSEEACSSPGSGKARAWGLAEQL